MKKRKEKNQERAVITMCGLYLDSDSYKMQKKIIYSICATLIALINSVNGFPEFTPSVLNPSSSLPFQLAFCLVGQRWGKQGLEKHSFISTFSLEHPSFALAPVFSSWKHTQHCQMEEKICGAESSCPDKALNMWKSKPRSTKSPS